MNVESFLTEQLAESYRKLSTDPDDTKLQGRIDALLDILDRIRAGDFDE